VEARFDAVLFDLLSGLLDSWSLWDRVAGGAERGRKWRLRYLELCYSAGDFRPFQALIEQAATDVGLPAQAGGTLIHEWDTIEPWPEVPSVLRTLPVAKVGVVTNSSEDLAHTGVARVGVPLDPVVSAERAGAYKPDPRPYRLALAELGVAPHRVLFVAGSPADIGGAKRVGMPVVWHNRAGLARPRGHEPVAVINHLSELTRLLAEV